MINGKPWYQSKTLWINITALVGGIGGYVATQETEPLIVSGLGLINFFLRLTTKQPIE